MENKPEIRVFLDTNVWFSGLYSAQNAPAKILTYFLEGKFTVVISQQGLDELVRTFQHKLPQGLNELNLLLMNSKIEIAQEPELSEIKPLTAILSFEDSVILAAAVSSKATIFVTGDNHSLKNSALSQIGGIVIQSPAVFLKRLE